jgi:hypothetical protein
MKDEDFIFLAACIVIIGFTACNDYQPKPVYKIPTGSMTELKYSVFNIDGCQYLLYEVGTSYGLTHKGDCTNTIGHKVFN